MFNKIMLCLAVGFVLTSCSTRHHPKMISFTPASVVVDYTKNDLHEATNLAQQFCSSINKDAQYVRTNETGFFSKERLAFFNCVESSNRNRSNNDSQSNSNHHIPIINNYK